MSNRYPSAVLFSALLHGGLIALVLLLTYVVGNRIKDAPRIIELVSGGNDNPGATEAPALGTPGGVKVDVPEPVKPVPAPVAPAPMQTVPVPKAADPASKIATAVKQIERKSDRVIARIQAEEQKKRQEEARKEAMTKEKFDALNKGKPAPMAKAAPPAKIPKVGEGIAAGVTGGSTANKIGGMGGKALTSDVQDEMQVYYAAFKQRLRDALEPPPGLSDTLVVKVTVTIAASGRISGASITKSSGSEEFDRAVLAALARVQMGARPDRRTDQVTFDLRLRDISGN